MASEAELRIIWTDAGGAPTPYQPPVPQLPVPQVPQGGTEPPPVPDNQAATPSTPAPPRPTDGPPPSTAPEGRRAKPVGRDDSTLSLFTDVAKALGFDQAAKVQKLAETYEKGLQGLILLLAKFGAIDFKRPEASSSTSATPPAAEIPKAAEPVGTPPEKPASTSTLPSAPTPTPPASREFVLPPSVEQNSAPEGPPPSTGPLPSPTSAPEGRHGLTAEEAKELFEKTGLTPEQVGLQVVTHKGPVTTPSSPAAPTAPPGRPAGNLPDGILPPENPLPTTPMLPPPMAPPASVLPNAIPTAPPGPPASVLPAGPITTAGAPPIAGAAAALPTGAPAGAVASALPAGPAAGAAAGGAEAAMAGLTAAIAPVAAVAAGVAVAIGAAALAAKLFADTLSAGADSIKEYSPDVAQANAENEVRQIFAMLRRSEQVGPQLATFQKDMGRLQETGTQIWTEILKMLTSIYEENREITEAAIVVSKVISATVPLIKEHLDVLVAVARGDGLKVIAETRDILPALLRALEKVVKILSGDDEMPEGFDPFEAIHELERLAAMAGIGIGGAVGGGGDAPAARGGRAGGGDEGRPGRAFRQRTPRLRKGGFGV